MAALADLPHDRRTAHDRPHPRSHEDNRRWWTLGAMCFALFMVMLDNTVVNVALPSIQRDLDASVSGLEWTVNAYTLAFAVLLVTGGRLGDIFGRRRDVPLRRRHVRASSAFIGFSQTEAWLVAGRAVQGIGAAFMMPATLSIISNAFPPAERGKAIGTWAGVSALALAIGPVVGGFLVENVSWQSIFFLNLPVAVGAVVVTLFATHESRDETAPRDVDIPGVATITVGLAALVLALVEGNSWGWGSPRIIGLLRRRRRRRWPRFVAHRARVARPDGRLHASSARARSWARTSSRSSCRFAMLAMFFFLALYMQNIKRLLAAGGRRALPALDRRDHLRRADRRAPDRPHRPAAADDHRPAAGRGSLFWQGHLAVDTATASSLGAFVLMGSAWASSCRR